MLEVSDVSYAYPDGHAALKAIRFALPKAHILAILGESGSGKTTLLKCIGKFLRPQSGKILLNGVDIDQIEERAFRRLIGIVFQQLYLFPHLSVLENMTLAPVNVLRKARKTAREEAIQTLERLRIGEIKDKYPAQISGGQAQRVAIARALLLKPEYLLLDEPTSALDVNTSGDFGRWLVNLKEETTFVVVTHDVLFAGRIATRGVLLAEGEIQTTGTIAHILETMENAAAKHSGAREIERRNIQDRKGGDRPWIR
jgi:ABC-type polar amino acid transport system ATPase subunit